jgi:hypothetical protein
VVKAKSQRHRILIDFMTLAINLSPVSTTPAMNQLPRHQLAYTSNKYKVKKMNCKQQPDDSISTKFLSQIFKKIYRRRRVTFMFEYLHKFSLTIEEAPMGETVS